METIYERIMNVIIVIEIIFPLKYFIEVMRQEVERVNFLSDDGIIPETNDCLAYLLSPRQREIFRLKSMGLNLDEIAQKLGISFFTVKNHISMALKKSGEVSTMHVIFALVSSNQIDRESISSGFNFGAYDNLSPKQKEILEYVSIPSTWYECCGKIAYDLGFKEQTLKAQLSDIYDVLDIRNLLTARVFMMLRASRYKPLKNSNTIVL